MLTINLHSICTMNKTYTRNQNRLCETLNYNKHQCIPPPSARTNHLCKRALIKILFGVMVFNQSVANICPKWKFSIVNITSEMENGLQILRSPNWIISDWCMSVCVDMHGWKYYEALDAAGVKEVQLGNFEST